MSLLDYARLEDMCRGPFFMGSSAACAANKLALERHFIAEWHSDIEATMETIHRDGPWQRIPALRVDVNGFEAVREYYLNRFANWPGPAMEFFTRVTVCDTCVYTEGTLSIEPRGAFGGREMTGQKILCPVIIAVDCRDGLILGETVYADGAALRGEAA
jgi:hypothetical protein